MSPSGGGRPSGRGAAFGPGHHLQTERLVLRRWREDDRDGFAALNANPVVMEHFPEPLTRERSDLMLDAIDNALEANGFGIWAVEELRSGALIGFAGLARVAFLAPFTPAVEVGWRLTPSAWGRGFATEAATAALDHGFATVRLPEVVSFTTATNRRSIAVMERLAMTHDPAEDFDHPQIARTNPLSRHVLYRISAERWRGAGGRAARRRLSPGSGPRR
ncbi:MAG TPA: GNAT family N-acetyltransferase [Solirubrobacteraceae bacterium]|nr:GNAT family N-acetyltransferase [Solirubrobacteraceae bacterium]